MNSNDIMIDIIAVINEYKAKRAETIKQLHTRLPQEIQTCYDGNIMYVFEEFGVSVATGPNNSAEIGFQERNVNGFHLMKNRSHIISEGLKSFPVVHLSYDEAAQVIVDFHKSN